MGGERIINLELAVMALDAPPSAIKSEKLFYWPAMA